SCFFAAIGRFYREPGLGLCIMSGELSSAQEVAVSPAKEILSPYAVHPGVAMVQKWIEELPGKTGRSLEGWIALTKTSGPPTEKERREWLKREHKLGANSAARIAERLEGKGTEEDSPEAYLKTASAWVEAQYSGPRGGVASAV
ncbi:MAG: DUF4287 domain-containing protein, partial [Terriglobales bacterium]